MTYAIGLPIENTRNWEVLCTHCRESIGTMNAEDIARAIHAKGPILCPDCRFRHCDYCGRITKHRLPVTNGHYATGPYRICPLCVQKRMSMQMPMFEKIITSHVREYCLNEEMVDIRKLLSEGRVLCLSSSPKVNNKDSAGGKNV